jgi:tRNA modification GTPase
VLVFSAPRSYTGEDVVELQCHGGSVPPRRVLEACLSEGARLARRGEFTQRAFLNGRLDLSAAEAVIDLIDARTDRAADDAVARLGGAAAEAFEAMYASALDLSSRVEHALDFDEDELPQDFAKRLARDMDALRARIAAHLATAREGRLLREGALVVLAGPPNSGKSSLLNALLGERRAIVSDAAGTTRDSIEEGVEIGGWPVRLVDTAGLRATSDAVEAEGVDRAEALIAQADLVLALDCDHPGALRLHAKCDLGPGEGLPVSALTGEGLAELRAEIAARLEQLAAKGSEASGADVTTCQKEQLEIAADALARADTSDLVVAANELRVAAEALGRIIGKVYSDDLLDSIFSRFCVGK